MMPNLDNPLVSILVPIYNVEKYLERCARSVFEQTYTYLEFVFVDDGCTDSSMAVLERVVDDYPSKKGKSIVIHHQRYRLRLCEADMKLDVVLPQQSN